jgi:circadian clock protein KaiB
VSDEGLVPPSKPDALARLPGPKVETGRESLVFRFTLYICGVTEKSQKAITSARRLCEEHLTGRYSLEVIDLYQHPELAHPGDIFAIPTLVREFPPPTRRFTGDLSSNERIVDEMRSWDLIDL